MIGNAFMRTYVYPAPCDMRKGFNGLCGLVEETLGQSVRSGAIFVFVNRRRTAVKLLCADETGLSILHRRLWQGRFPKVWDLDRRDDGRVRLTQSELALLLEGGDLITHRAHKS